MEAFALDFEVRSSEGLLRRVRLFVVGEPAALARIESVEFDLGPTFDQPLRRVTSASFETEFEAYGSFDAMATVHEHGGSVQRLPCAVDLPTLGGEVAAAEPAIRSRLEFPRRASIASAQGVRLELLVGLLLFAAGVAMLALWPDGTDHLSLIAALGGPRIVCDLATRLLLLAAAGGAWGALLQVGYSIATHLEAHTLTAAWVRWYLLRVPVGAVFGLLAYAVLRTLFVSGEAANAIAPAGVALLAVGAGWGSAGATSRLHTILEGLFGPLLSEPAPTQEEYRMNHSPDSHPSADADADADAERRRDIESAQSILRGSDATPRQTFDLAERLKKVNEFGYARRLLGRIQAKGDYAGVRKGETPQQALQHAAVKVGQQQALCTYKDPDLPVSERFRRALELLDDVDRLEMSDAQRQESLGLRGAVYKRRWQIEGQRADLVSARGCYQRGYELGPTGDQGYTGINAAFVIDLIAREEAAEARRTQGDWRHAEALWCEAREIRTTLVERLPRLPEQQSHAWLSGEWWFHATVAEAHLGLGHFDEALKALRGFHHELERRGLDATGKPPPWEFESTLSQLASLARVQAELLESFAGFEGWQAPAGLDPKTYAARARAVLREYLGEDREAAVERVFNGKLGLALSGGGFRASLFHVGVLACLAEHDVLRRVEVLSCVSGGSIVGAHYYLELQRLLEAKRDAEIDGQDYVDLVERLESDFLAGVQTNIRARTFGSIWANLRAFFQPGYTTTRHLGEQYEAQLYARVADGRNAAPRHLADLVVRPPGENNFKPKYDNWRRRAKVPELVLNAATLNTGHIWQFTATWMGEPPGRQDAEIGGNYRLRRMYHHEAPRRPDRWESWYLRPFAPPDYRKLRLGDAVAASSCVPGLFEPIVFPDLFDGKTVRLVDGGVNDNQGVASLLEQDCSVMIVSDASGQMDAQDRPSGSKLGVPLRSFSLSMARVRQTQFEALDARRRAGLLRGLMFLHLRRDLNADPVDWRECQDPFEASDEARPAEQRGVLTRYGLQKSVQRLLSALRTDLDSFTELEAFSLMTSGYRQARLDIAHLPGVEKPKQHRPWRFLQVEPVLGPGAGFDEVQKQLRVGGNTAGKVWLLWMPLTLLGAVLSLLAVLALAWLWWIHRDRTLLTVYGLGMGAAGLAATVAAPHLMRLVRYRKTFRDVGIRGLVAAVVAIGFKIHLALFDPLFLRLGRVGRALAQRERTRAE